MKLMRLSDTKMPRSLSGKMPLILPLVLLLALFVIATTHLRVYEECFAMFAVGMLFTMPSCLAIAFCRSDKSAVVMFSLSVISLLLLSCLFFLFPIPGHQFRGD